MIIPEWLFELSILKPESIEFQYKKAYVTNKDQKEVIDSP